MKTNGEPTELLVRRALFIAGSLLAGSLGTATTSSAQTAPQVLYACYVPATGTVYRIKEPGLPQECQGKNNGKHDHVEFSWNATGLQGLQGPQGPQGLKGDTGAAGSQGERGPAGPQGLVGPAGERGADGAPGAQGPKGDNGAAGPAGPKGDKGDPGVAGPQGAKGETGATGMTGPAGPQGQQGVDGAVGPQGSQGSKGETGATGAAGPQGPKGDTGPQGPKGDKGDPGAPGPAGGALTMNDWTAASQSRTGYGAFEFRIACPAGKFPISGGYEGLSSPAITYTRSHPFFNSGGQDGWLLSGWNTTDGTVSVIMFLLCAPKT